MYQNQMPQQQYQQPPMGQQPMQQQGYAPQQGYQQPPMGQQPMQQQGYAPQQGYQQPMQQQQSQQYAAPAQAPAAANNGSSLMIQGRLVWIAGSLFAGKAKTDQNTRQPIIDQKTGQQVVEYAFGVAVPKGSPSHIAFEQESKKQALTIYPNGQIPPNFSYKFKDGDGVDHNGASFAQREGYAGHIVITCSTRIPPKFFIFQGGNNILVNDGIKCGDYVDVQLNLAAHPKIGTGLPGLYTNPGAVRLIQAGKEIINAPSGDQMFGTTAPSYAGQMVADTGAGAMPNMGGQAPMNQGFAPQQPMGQQYAPQAPQQGYQQPQAPQADPHYGVLPQHHQPMPGQQQFAPQQPQYNPQQGYAPMPGQMPQR